MFDNLKRLWRQSQVATVATVAAEPVADTTPDHSGVSGVLMRVKGSPDLIRMPYNGYSFDRSALILEVSGNGCPTNPSRVVAVYHVSGLEVKATQQTEKAIKRMGTVEEEPGAGVHDVQLTEPGRHVFTTAERLDSIDAALALIPPTAWGSVKVVYQRVPLPSSVNLPAALKVGAESVVPAPDALLRIVLECVTVPETGNAYLVTCCETRYSYQLRYGQ